MIDVSPADLFCVSGSMLRICLLSRRQRRTLRRCLGPYGFLSFFGRNSRADRLAKARSGVDDCGFCGIYRSNPHCFKERSLLANLVCRILPCRGCHPFLDRCDASFRSESLCLGRRFLGVSGSRLLGDRGPKSPPFDPETPGHFIMRQ